MNGFIYIMSNPIFNDGRIKIGKSKSDTSSFRKDELFSTGVPEPFKVEYFAFVEDFDDIEIQVHRTLNSTRPRKDREFFTSSIPEAIKAIKDVANIKYEENFYEFQKEIENEKLEKNKEEEKKVHYETYISQVTKERSDFVINEFEKNPKYFFYRLPVSIIVSLIFGFFLVFVFKFFGYGFMPFLGSIIPFVYLKNFGDETKIKLKETAEKKFPVIPFDEFSKTEI